MRVRILSSSPLSGLDLIWRLYLNSTNEELANKLRMHLLALYHGGVVYHTTSKLRKELIK